MRARGILGPLLAVLDAMFLTNDDFYNLCPCAPRFAAAVHSASWFALSISHFAEKAKQSFGEHGGRREAKQNFSCTCTSICGISGFWKS